MSKIGNTRTGITQSFPSKQNITGNGGTSYTLNHTVTQPEELEVFVNNVRQNPGDAYTVNHNTITFAGAISSTDSCYAVFQNNINRNPAQFDFSRTVTTLNANNVLTDSSTSGGITSSVVGGQSTIQKDGALNIRGNWIRFQKPNSATDMIVAKPNNEVELYHNGSQKLETTSTGVDVTGSLNISAQPSCLLKKNGNLSAPQNSAFSVTGWTSVHDVGSMFDSSNSRITVPTAGSYIVGAALQASGVTGLHIAILKNDAAIGTDSYLNVIDAGAVAMSICVTASANDFFTVSAYVTHSGLNIQGNRSKFWVVKVA